MFCAHCGAHNAEGFNFCATCGHKLLSGSAPEESPTGTASPVTVTTAPLEPPPAANPVTTHVAAAPGAPAPSHAPVERVVPVETSPAPNPLPSIKLPRFDVAQILTGDWLGALRTAAGTVLTALVLSAALLALMHPDGVSPKGFMTLVVIVSAAAFGGDFGYTSHDAGTSTVSYGAYPLTITGIALTVAAVLLARQLKGYADWTGRVTHAIRTAILFAALLIALTAIFQSKVKPLHSPTIGVNDPATAAAGFFAEQGTYHANVVSTASLGAMWMLLVAAVLIFMRDLTLPAPIQQARAWLALPLKSIVVLFVASGLAGLVGAIVLFATREEARNTSTVALWLAGLPDLGLNLVYLGAGASVHTIAVSSPKSGGSHDSAHLTHFTSHVTHWLWVAPIATLFVLGASALYVAVRSPHAQTVSADVLRWLVGLVIATPVLVHLSSLHFRVTYSGDGSGLKDQWYRSVFGMDQWQSIGLAAAWGFAIAVVLAGIARATHSSASQPAADPLPGANAQPG